MSEKPHIIEPPYFSNWADQFMPKIANTLVPFAAQIPWLTPNHLTLLSFVLHVLGSILIFVSIPYHLIFTAILLPLGYILDCMDGQLARTKNMPSPLGDYLDKTLDVLKVFILTASLSYATYMKTDDILYIFLGFTACFGFCFRYYIKLETIFSTINRDKDYLQKSREQRFELYEKLGREYKELSKTFLGKLKALWYKNRILFFIDEAEFILITSITVLLNRIEIALWIFAILHFGIAIFRLFERGYQVNTFSKNLYLPMRK